MLYLQIVFFTSHILILPCGLSIIQFLGIACRDLARIRCSRIYSGTSFHVYGNYCFLFGFLPRTGSFKQDISSLINRYVYLRLSYVYCSCVSPSCSINKSTFSTLHNKTKVSPPCVLYYCIYSFQDVLDFIF